MCSSSCNEAMTFAFCGCKYKNFIYKKEVIKVVLLDELEQNLTAYEEPLKDLRDSL